MNKCLSCLHYEVCDYRINEENITVAECTQFTDRSEWVHLPCEVGNKAYYLRRNPKTFEWHIQETKVYTIDIRYDGLYIYVNYGLSCYAPKEIGKRLFLIREEAEKALEKIKREK